MIERETAQAYARRAAGRLAKYKYAAAVLAVGLVLLVSGGDAPDQPHSAPVAQEQGFDLAAFETQAAERLSHIDGVGKLELMLTLEASGEAVYASDTRRSVSGEQSGSFESSVTVVSGGSAGQKPVTVKEIYPTFRGAVVLCEGADRVGVRYAVTQAVTALCGIGADKVAVLKMETGA